MRAGGVRATATAVVAAVLLVTACGGGDPSDEGAGAASRPGGGWSFTDDRGVTHALDAPPDVIVAQSVSAGGLSEYGVDVAGVFGPCAGPTARPTRPSASPTPTRSPRAARSTAR
jgi:iron complex transport system substrate-binding protein